MVERLVDENLIANFEIIKLFHKVLLSNVIIIHVAIRNSTYISTIPTIAKIRIISEIFLFI